MKIRNTFAMACVLVWAICPTVFALERGKQIVKREVARLVRTSPSLLNQLRAMNVGEVTMDDDVITVTRPEATFVFHLDQFSALAEGGASGRVTIYGNQSGEEAEAIISVKAIDDNRIDFSTAISMADGQRTETGTIIGISPDRAIAIASVNGGDTISSLINFEQATVTSSDVPALPVTITTASTTTTNSDVDSDFGSIASGFWEWLACAVGWEVCAGVIIVVVLFVGVTCLAFGWFGCGN